MRTCSIPGCERKHHGKGYCKIHYKKYILIEFYASKKCYIEGCNRSVCTSSAGKYYCSMHGTRLKRNQPLGDGMGNRSRMYFSFAMELSKSSNPLDFEIPNRESWAIASKIYYGNVCVECGWDKGECDAHHKIPFGDGGKNTINNASILCPNCHRLAHTRKRKRFSNESISQFAEVISRIRP